MICVMICVDTFNSRNLFFERTQYAGKTNVTDLLNRFIIFLEGSVLLKLTKKNCLCKYIKYSHRVEEVGSSLTALERLGDKDQT